MSRYIDADALIKWCDDTMKAQSTTVGMAYVNQFIVAVLSRTTEDVVEVVRCKDCIHSSYCGKICHYSIGRDTSPDHYCSYGERREDKDAIT